MKRLRRLIEVSHAQLAARLICSAKRNFPPLSDFRLGLRDSSINAPEAVLADASLKEIFAATLS